MAKKMIQKVKDQVGDEASMKGSGRASGLNAAPVSGLCDNHYHTFDVGVDTASSSIFLGMTWSMAVATAWGNLWFIWSLRSKSPGLPTLAKAREALSHWGILAVILSPMH